MGGEKPDGLDWKAWVTFGGVFAAIGIGVVALKIHGPQLARAATDEWKGRACADVLRERIRKEGDIRLDATVEKCVPDGSGRATCFVRMLHEDGQYRTTTFPTDCKSGSLSL